MKVFKKYIFIPFLILFLSLILLEIILIATGWIYQETRKNEFFDYKHKASKEVTILTLGDSYTYGGNVNWNQTYSYLLWEKLSISQKDIRINLINGGICEYNSSQVLYELDKNIEKYIPDYVIILVGSSDFWNLINPRLKDEFSINNPSYDSEQIEIKNRMNSNSNKILSKFKTYKFFRLLFLNINAQKAIKKMEKGFIELNEIEIGHITSEIFMKMLKSKQYSKIIEYSLNILKSLPPDSIYFSKSLSIFYAISIAYQMQSKYTANEIAQELENILIEKNIKKNDFVLKYIKYFKEKERFENLAKKRLEHNLKKINTKLTKKGITPIFLTYPLEYKIANTIIRKVTAESNSYLIDLELEFKKLNTDLKLGKYFDDDEHINYKGHKIVTDKILEFLNPKI